MRKARVGLFPPLDLLDWGQERARAYLARIAEAGIDHVCWHEVSICGVDPATRGQRMNECLAVLRELLTGGPQTFHRRYFDFDEAVIAPPPAPAIQVIVEGWSNAAVRRAGRLGDGCPYGTAEDVAEFLAPYAEAGCTEFNLIPQSPDHDYSIAGVAAVRKLLAQT